MYPAPAASMRVNAAASSLFFIALSSLELRVTRLVGVEGVGIEVKVREEMEMMGVWTPQKHLPLHLKGKSVHKRNVTI